MWNPEFPAGPLARLHMPYTWTFHWWKHELIYPSHSCWYVNCLWEHCSDLMVCFLFLCHKDRACFLWQKEWYLRNCVLFELTMLKMIENKQIPLVLCCLCREPLAVCLILLLMWGWPQVSFQEEPPCFFGGCVCCGWTAVVQQSPLSMTLGAVLQNLHTHLIQQMVIQCLLNLRQFVGILEDLKASKTKPPLTRRYDYLSGIRALWTWIT